MDTGCGQEEQIQEVGQRSEAVTAMTSAALTEFAHYSEVEEEEEEHLQAVGVVLLYRQIFLLVFYSN